MTQVFLSLGSNLGDGVNILSQAASDLRGFADGGVSFSSIYRTRPIGDSRQPWYLNCVAGLQTDLAPRAMLGKALALEAARGRSSSKRWGPRRLDIDILYFGDCVLDEPDLIIPHPRLRFRPFVLVPLSEIAPGWRDPVIRVSIAELARTAGQQGVEWFSTGPQQGNTHAASVCGH